jgi:hypothetical protein
MHAHRFIDTQRSEHMIEDRHHHNTATDTEHTGNETPDHARDQESGGKRAELAV